MVLRWKKRRPLLTAEKVTFPLEPRYSSTGCSKNQVTFKLIPKTDFPRVGNARGGRTHCETLYSPQQRGQRDTGCADISGAQGKGARAIDSLGGEPHSRGQTASGSGGRHWGGSVRCQFPLCSFLAAVHTTAAVIPLPVEESIWFMPRAMELTQDFTRNLPEFTQDECARGSRFREEEPDDARESQQSSKPAERGRGRLARPRKKHVIHMHGCRLLLTSGATFAKGAPSHARCHACRSPKARKRVIAAIWRRQTRTAHEKW